MRNQRSGLASRSVALAVLGVGGVSLLCIILSSGVGLMAPRVGRISPGVGMIAPRVRIISLGVGLIPLCVGMFSLGIGMTALRIGTIQLRVGVIPPGIGTIWLSLGVIPPFRNVAPLGYLMAPQLIEAVPQSVELRCRLNSEARKPGKIITYFLDSWFLNLIELGTQEWNQRDERHRR